MWRKHHKWYMPWRHVNWRCNSIKSASCLLFFGLKHCYVKTNTCKLIVRSSCHSSERESPILAKSVTDWKQNHLFFHHYFSNFPLWFRRSVGIYVFWLSGIFGADQQNTIFVFFRWKLCTCVGDILHFRIHKFGILYLKNFAFSDVCLSMLSVAPLPIGAPGPLLTWIKTDMEQVSMVTILRGVIINAGWNIVDCPTQL